MPPLADEGVLTLTLFVLKDWRHSVESCAGDGTGFLDLQLVLSTHPAQSILIHSLQGSAADSEVVAAGKSDRSPAPPMNALFHVFFGAPHALSEIAGVRTSDTEVAVYANTWLEERVAGEAKLGLSTGVRLVGTLRWPRGVPFQVVPKAPPDFSETDAELNARFPRCPP